MSVIEQREAISLTNIKFKYPNNGHYSLDDISMTIKSGECTGIIGQNGAGKSTLISILCGLITPETGEVVYAANPHETVEFNVKDNVALVPQEYAFYPELTVKQNLEFFIALSEKNKHKRIEIIDDVITQCQLSMVKNTKANTLSGGYKRRLNIAIALSKQPSIIFLDEPTVGIDPVSRAHIIELLQSLKRQGLTLIYTSHMLSEVEALCDDVYLLGNGRLIGSGGADENASYVTVEFKPNAPQLEINEIFSIPLSFENNNVSIKITQSHSLGLQLNQLSQCSQWIERLHFSHRSLEQLYFDVCQERSC